MVVSVDERYDGIQVDVIWRNVHHLQIFKDTFLSYIYMCV